MKLGNCVVDFVQAWSWTTRSSQGFLFALPEFPRKIEEDLAEHLKEATRLKVAYFKRLCR
jgi:hypothetical protein